MRTLPATSPDQLTINLGDAVFCFEHASVLLEQGIRPLDAEAYGWLIGASDALLKAGLDLASGTLRYALLTETAAIERRDARARELIASEKVAMMRQEVEPCSKLIQDSSTARRRAWPGK